MAALGGLPMVGMATKGVTLSKNAKKVAQHKEMLDTNLLARALSNIGFGVGAGQSSAKTAQEVMQKASDYENEQAFKNGFASARGGVGL